MTLKGLRRWLVFNTVGSMGVAVQLVVLVTLTEVADLDYLIATGLAVESAVLHNFVWHECWTWRDRRFGKPGWGVRLLRFNLLTGTLSIAANVVFTGFYVATLGVHYALANVMAIATGSVLTFIASDRFVFRRIPAPDGCPGCRPTAS